MAELKVDEIETISTNQDIKVVTKSPDGALEIKGNGGNDGTLQLNCSAQSHGVKLKAPPNSAGQNYTMVLPDNQIAATKYLKVKSVTGSGSTAVGQLEYGDPPVADLTNLNADNLTSGTLPSARFSVPASAGAGFSLVSKSTVGDLATYSTNQSVTSIDFTSLSANTLYRMVGKNVRFNNYSSMILFFLDSSNNSITSGYPVVYSNFQNYYPYGTTTYQMVSTTAESYVNLQFSYLYNFETHGFVLDLYTGDGQGDNNHPYYGSKPWLMGSGMYPGRSSSGSQFYGSFNSYTGSINQAHGIRLSGTSSNDTFDWGTEILFYKYEES